MPLLRGVTCGLFVCFLFVSAGAARSSPALSSYERSVAYIDVARRCAPQCDDRVGSGFVVWRDDQATYIVTAAHVLGSDWREAHVFVGDDTSVDYRAHVLFSDRTYDVAVLAIAATPAADLVHLASPPAAGGRVYSVGYGRQAQYWLNRTGTIRPIVTTGLISRAAPRGQFVSSSISEAGQSGGPMLDESGNVVGIIRAEPVTGAFRNVAFYAVGAPAIARDLATHHVPYQADFTRPVNSGDQELAVAAGPVPDASGRGRIAFAASGDGTVGYTGEMAYSSYSVLQGVQQATQAFLRQETHADMIAASVYGTDDKDLARLPSTVQAAGGVYILSHFNARQLDPLTNRLDASIEIWIVGQRGGVWFHDKEAYEKQRYFPFSQSDTENVFAQLLSGGLSIFSQEMGDNSGFLDLSRYGVPVALDRRASFLSIELHGDEGIAEHVGAAGVAALAGLRDGDIIVRVNGRTLDKIQLSEISRLLHGADPVVLTVQGPDGRDYTLTFTPQTVRWYVDHAQRG